MYQINSRNVNDAFAQGLELLRNVGEWQNSRAGRVLVAPAPVVTTYHHPMERVLFHPQRDANPFFHLFEACWILAGRNDVVWLDQFVKDFSARYAEEGDGRMHGAYGYRWRQHFDMEGGGCPRLPDQLTTIIELLKANPDDRRIVLQMWDPVADLAVNAKDVPCNLNVMFRVREAPDCPTCGGSGFVGPETGYDGVCGNCGGQKKTGPSILDMTVTCRSNDAVWGAYGANAVHFSVLHEYVARHIGVAIGNYVQFSNNFHIYEPVLEKLTPLAKAEPRYPSMRTTPIVTNPGGAFDKDLELFFSPDWWWKRELYTNSFFPGIAVPMRDSYALWREGKRAAAIDLVSAGVSDLDWLVAAREWYERRLTPKTKELRQHAG